VHCELTGALFLTSHRLPDGPSYPVTPAQLQTLLFFALVLVMALGVFLLLIALYWLLSAVNGRRQRQVLVRSLRVAERNRSREKAEPYKAVLIRESTD